ARGRRGDGQRAAHAVHVAVEPELAEDAPGGEVGERRLGLGGEDAEGDGEVVVRPLLAHAGGGEVHGDAALGVLEAGVPERGPDAVGGLAHGAVGTADGGRVREARRHVDLDVDDERVYAAEA